MQRLTGNGLLDKLAVMLSAICLVHCLATAILFGALSAAGGLLGSPVIHAAGLAVAIILGVGALGNGLRLHRQRLPLLIGGTGLALMAFALSLGHGSGETLFTMIGVAVLAAGHMLNRRALA